MESPAQSNTQLFRQIVEHGCSAEELGLMRDAYGLAMQIYSGLFTGSGKPTLTHEVGSASLALRYGGSFELAAAALMHGAYIDLTLEAELPPELVGLPRPNEHAPMLFVPHSCRRRWPVRLYWALARVAARA